MIEVEQKFILTEKDEQLLTQGAQFLGEKTFTDIYYDTAEYTLTKSNIWLRKRGENWEVKIPTGNTGNGMTQQYQEIEGEEKIRQVFDVAPKNDFEKDITEYGYAPFCICQTTRRKYAREKFIIDLDTAAIGEDFSYHIGEIEMMVPSEEQAENATEEILRFAKSLGIEALPVRGKVIEYLKRKKPDHYQALMEAGVVWE
jgi:adenylate cyclase class IV